MLDDPETRTSRLGARLEGLESLLNTAIGAVDNLAEAVNTLIDKDIAQASLIDRLEISDQVLPS